MGKSERASFRDRLSGISASQGPWKIACHRGRASYCYSYQPYVIYRPRLSSSSSSSYIVSCRDFAIPRIPFFSFRTREKETSTVTNDDFVNSSRNVSRAFDLHSSLPILLVELFVCKCMHIRGRKTS